MKKKCDNGKPIKRMSPEKDFVINHMPDFIAEFNKDGKYNKTAWDFWRWLIKKFK